MKNRLNIGDNSIKNLSKLTKIELEREQAKPELKKMNKKTKEINRKLNFEPDSSKNQSNPLCVTIQKTVNDLLR